MSTGNEHNFKGVTMVRSQNKVENNFFNLQLIKFYKKKLIKIVKETRKVLNCICSRFSLIDNIFLKKHKAKIENSTP